MAETTLSATQTDGDPAAKLLARREQLRMRSAVLRQSLAWRSQKIRPAFRASDRALEGLQWARQHREMIGVVAAAILGGLAVRPRALISLGARAYTGWKLFQRIQPMLRTLMRR